MWFWSFMAGKMRLAKTQKLGLKSFSHFVFFSSFSSQSLFYVTIFNVFVAFFFLSFPFCLRNKFCGVHEPIIKYWTLGHWKSFRLIRTKYNVQMESYYTFGRLYGKLSNIMQIWWPLWKKGKKKKRKTYTEYILKKRQAKESQAAATKKDFLFCRSFVSLYIFLPAKTNKNGSSAINSGYIFGGK